MLDLVPQILLSICIWYKFFYKFGTGTPVLKRYSAIYRRYQMIHKQSPTPNNSGLYKGSFQKQNKKILVGKVH